MKPIEQKILNAGVALWPDVTLSAIARALDLNSHVNIFHYFKNVKELKDAIAVYAVKTGNSRVIMQLVAADHAAVKDLSQADRIRHFNAVTV